MRYLCLAITLSLGANLAVASEREAAIKFIMGGGNQQVAEKIEVNQCKGTQKVYLRQLTQISPESYTDEAYLALSFDFSEAIWESYRREWSQPHGSEVIKIGCANECRTFDVVTTTEPPHPNAEFLAMHAGGMQGLNRGDQIVFPPQVAQTRIDKAVGALSKECGADDTQF